MSLPINFASGGLPTLATNMFNTFPPVAGASFNQNSSVNPLIGIPTGSPNPPGYSNGSINSKLKLGGILFQDFEVPERLEYLGGRQIVAIHEFVGGLRQLQALGPQPGPISWSGILIGGDPSGGAKPRVIQIDAVRQQGLIVQLSWANYLFDVIVTDFKPEIQNDWIIPYSITCEVQKDHSSIIPQIAPGPNEVYAAQYSELLNNAIAMSNTWSTAANQAVASALANDLQVINSLKQQTIQLMQPQEINYAIETLSNDIQNLIPISTGNILSDAAGAYVLINQTKNLINLFRGNTGNSIKTIPVVNPNLFEQSTNIYGSPNFWQQVAANNGLPQDNPLITGAFPNFIVSPQVGGTSQ